MKAKSITVTEAARNFAECVNQVHYQNASFVLLKNGKPVARISPADRRSCTGRELAEALGAAALPTMEARAWLRDLKTARKHLKSPGDKWR